MKKIALKYDKSFYTFKGWMKPGHIARWIPIVEHMSFGDIKINGYKEKIKRTPWLMWKSIKLS